MMGRYPHFGARPGSTDLDICEEVMRFFEVDVMADRSYGTLKQTTETRRSRRNAVFFNTFSVLSVPLW